MTTYAGGQSYPTINVVPRSWTQVLSAVSVPAGGYVDLGTSVIDFLNNTENLTGTHQPIVGYVETFALYVAAGAAGPIALEPAFYVTAWYGLTTTNLAVAALTEHTLQANIRIYPAFPQFRYRITNGGGNAATVTGVITLRAG